MATVIKLKRSETALAIPSAGSLAAGELALNITDGKFYTKTSGGVTTNDITLNGSNLVFEGFLENAFETTLTVAEPTADRTITLPNQSGTVAMDGDALAYSIVFGG